MGQPETEMGGSREAFPETVWSTILSSAAGEGGARRERMEKLIRRYWRPVYMYIRASDGRSIEDAKDLAQEFFLLVLDDQGIAGYEPRQGRFRHYLKGAVRHFLANERRGARREKRGGGRDILSLDVEGLETEKFVAERRTATPEEIFDRQWAHDHLAAALAELKRILTEEGQAIRYKVFEAHSLSLASGSRPTYGDIAERLSISQWDVKYHLEEARARLNDLLAQSIADSVASREELIREMTDLFSR